MVNAFEAQQAQLQQPVTPVTPVTPSFVEEFDASLENIPSSRHRNETRRVHFAQIPEIIRFPHPYHLIQITAQDTTLNSAEESVHGEAARAG